MSNKNIFISGIPDLLILLILQQEDSYVYEITKKITTLSNETLTISQNTIYTAIYKLTLGGYISEYQKQVGRKRIRVYYHLEEKGKAHLATLLDNYLQTTSGMNHVLRSLNITKGEDYK